MSNKRNRKVNWELCPTVGAMVAEDDRLEALAGAMLMADETQVSTLQGEIKASVESRYGMPLSAQDLQAYIAQLQWRVLDPRAADDHYLRVLFSPIQE
jgi:hypothetical protein